MAKVFNIAENEQENDESVLFLWKENRRMTIVFCCDENRTRGCQKCLSLVTRPQQVSLVGNIHNLEL